MCKLVPAFKRGIPSEPFMAGMLPEAEYVGSHIRSHGHDAGLLRPSPGGGVMRIAGYRACPG